MKTIKIKEYEVMIDDEDFDRVNAYKWHLNRSSRYHIYANSVFKVDGKKQTVIMHRFIMGLDKVKGLDVDHINGNTLDNRKCNLRACSRSKNLLNRHNLMANNTSGHTGVWHPRDKNRWYAKIYVNYKRVHLGTFVSKEDAIKARKEAEAKYF